MKRSPLLCPTREVNRSDIRAGGNAIGNCFINVLGINRAFYTYGGKGKPGGAVKFSFFAKPSRSCHISEARGANCESYVWGADDQYRIAFPHNNPNPEDQLTLPQLAAAPGAASVAFLDAHVAQVERRRVPLAVRGTALSQSFWNYSTRLKSSLGNIVDTW